MKKTPDILNRNIARQNQIEQNLRETEQNYRFLSEGIKDMVWTSSPDGKLDYINQRTVEYFGRKEKEILWDGWQNLVHPDDLPRCIVRWNHSVETGDDYEVEFRLKKFNGEYRWHIARAAARIDSDGKIIKWYGTSLDIHQQKLTEAALKRGEERFRSIVETTSDWIWETDAAGKATYSNPAIEAILGYKPEELIGKTFISLQHPESVQKAEKTFINCVSEKRGWRSMVCRWLHKNGESRYIECTSTPILDADGELAGFRGVARDITEKKESEIRLSSSETNLAAAQRIAQLGSWEIELSDSKWIDENKLVLSDEVYRIFGYEPEQFNVSFNNLFNSAVQESRNDVRQAFIEAISHRKDLDIEYLILLPNGEKRFHHALGEVVYDEKTNQPLKFVGTLQDITERKLTQAELQKNISLLNSTFEATADGIFVVDKKGSILTFNNRFLEIMEIPDGQGKNELSVGNLPDNLDNAEEFIESTKKLIQNPEIKHSDLMKFKNGKVIERWSQPQILEGNVIGRVISFRDVTEHIQAKENLEKERKFLDAVLNNLMDGLVACNAAGELTLFNRASQEFHGLSAEPLPPEKWAEHYDLYQADGKTPLTKIEVPLFRALQGENVSNVEIVISPKNKPPRTLIVSGQPIFDTYGKKIGAVAGMHDITERKRAEENLRESESKLLILLKSMSEGLLQVNDENEVIEFVNDSFCEMVGYTKQELIGNDWCSLMLDEEGCKLVDQVNIRRSQGISDRYELRLKKKSGEMMWVMVGGSPMFDANGKMTGKMGIFTDITERKRIEKQLVHDAFHDGLTGLANRDLFIDHLRMAIERGKSQYSNHYAVLFLDFDRFKVVNDSLGHTQGDNLLKSIAQRLVSCTRTGDLVARFGGDEFVILLSEMPEINSAVQIAERIQKDMEKPFHLDANEIYISASIGIALSTARHKRAEDMIRDADIAMYRAKEKGKARYEVFDHTMHAHASQKLQMETEMRQALDRHEFELHYQPILELEDESLVGFESLVRWNHPVRGMVSPLEFIKESEENGLILPLGKWILRKSCYQMRQWQIDNPDMTEMFISVNLSSKQFSQSDLVEQVAEALEDSGLDPRCLKLEITESHIMENSKKAINIMNQLCELGIQMSLDDFGTGYSSLSYLHSLPVNYLKIDRSFVMQMEQSKENEEIVHTIVKLARNLKMKVVAEGIETAEQLGKLKDLRCEYGQGYYFSKPLCVQNAQKFIEQFSQNSVIVKDRNIINLEKSM